MFKCNFIYLLMSIFLFSSCSSYVNRLHNDIDKKRRHINRYPQSNNIDSHGQNKPGYRKRFIADDFQDNEPSQSLWVGNGNESFFSSGGTRKEKGDLVTIMVYSKLKKLIQSELERIYPAKEKDEENQKESAPTAPATASSDVDKKLFDKISSTVTKEIRNNHIVLSGRKQIMFKNNKHLVEVKALVNRKDVTVDDTIDSEKILQSSIKVLR